MKVLVLANNITWTDKIKEKTEAVKKFYSSAIDLEFTIENCYYSSIPYDPLPSVDGNGQPYYILDETWYDQNISIPANKRGFDFVILLLRPDQYNFGNVDGYGTLEDCGVEEIVILANKSLRKYNFMGVNYSGDQLTHVLTHELMHRLYSFFKIEDNTHKWYLAKTPEKCLPELKAAKVPRLQAILVRNKSEAKQTLGTLIATKNGDFLILKTLELPDLNNKVDISCIPTGVYSVDWTWSPKFQKYTYEVTKVPNRPGIRIHAGNYHTDIEGCILLGDKYTDLNKDGVLDIVNSRISVDKLQDFFARQSFTLIIV